MAKATSRMSAYELERLERIKENEKMLEELFPKGTQAVFSQMKPTKKRREINGYSRRIGSGANSECPSDRSYSDEETNHKGNTRVSVSKRIKVETRRNPPRKARPDFTDCEGLFRMRTRSMNVSGEERLVEGIEDDKQLRRTVYKTIRHRVQTMTEEPPIELDDRPAYPVTRHIDVITSSSNKIYDTVRGTTCHQCRQKTVDAKTICHNKHCRGVRGQLCAPCLQNRYGEGLVESLQSAKWVCPPCRKICNCSFCLPKRGKPPTGILIHHARDAGCGNVHEYLTKTDYDY